MAEKGWDAIVVGSGLGGMSAAAFLAATGHRTLVLERYDVIGGSSHVFRRRGAWEFDCGVHYLGDCGPTGQIPTLLRGLGLDDRVEWLPLDPGGFDTIVGPDLELRVPSGWDAYLQRLLDAFPAEERGLRRFVSVVRRIGEPQDRSLTPSSMSVMSRYIAQCGWAAPSVMMPYLGLLVACGLKPRTVYALSVQCGALASAPHRLTTGVMAGFLQNYVGGGAYYPRGGGQMLAAAFADVVAGHDGSIRTRAEVERILVEGGRVAGVRLRGGEEIRCPIVVSDADIVRTYRDLVGLEHLPYHLAAAVRRWTMSRPLINGFYGVEIDPSTLPNSNHYVIPSWRDADSLMSLRRMSWRLVDRADRRDPLDWAHDFAANQVGFVQCSTRRDPDNARSAPSGHAAIEVQTTAPADPRLWGFDGADVAGHGYRGRVRYNDVKEILLEGFAQRIERAYPGASFRVVWRELGTPATQERYTHSTAGNSFGLEARPSQFGPLRPRAVTPVHGLFLAGTSTAWGPGTEGAMLSGMHAVAAISGRDLHAELHGGRVIVDRRRLPERAADFDPLSASRGLGRLTAESRSRRTRNPIG